jgi:hypothetical protein
VHRGHLLELLLDESIEEAHADIILVPLGDLDQVVDLAGDLLLPAQGLGRGVLDRVKVGARLPSGPSRALVRRQTRLPALGSVVLRLCHFTRTGFAHLTQISRPKYGEGHLRL